MLLALPMPPSSLTVTETNSLAPNSLLLSVMPVPETTASTPVTSVKVLMAAWMVVRLWLEIHVVPLLLGGGARLLEHLDAREVKLEPIRAVAGPGVIHIKYRVVR
jgi:hypothetical protein